MDAIGTFDDRLEPNTRRVALRVSTRDGRQETDNQRLQLHRLANSQTWKIVHEVTVLSQIAAKVGGGK